MESDNDSDIDKQIEDIIKDIPVEKKPSVTPREKSQEPSSKPTTATTQSNEKSNENIITPSAPSLSKSNSSKQNTGKSVRFQDQDDNDNDSTRFKKPSFITNMFFASDADSDSKGNETKVPSDITNKKSSEGNKESNKTDNDNGDWLGYGLSDNSVTKSSVGETGPRTNKQSSLDVFMMDHDFSLPLSKEEEHSEFISNKNKPPVPSSKSEVQITSPKKASTSKPTFSLDSLMESANKNITVKPPASPALETVSQLRQANKSILDALPFLRDSGSNFPQPQFQVGDGDVIRNSNGRESPQTQNPPKSQATTGKIKKKVVSAKSVTDTSSGTSFGGNTLQLPVHLVNENELKAMSSSLKTLYTNQLELQEQCFKEQLEFQASANKRREELLKAEMDRMQAEYELRFQKSQSNLMDKDNSSPQKPDQDFSQIASQIETLVRMQSSRDETTKMPLTLDEMTKVFEQTMSTTLGQLEAKMSEKLEAVAKNVLEVKVNPDTQKLESKIKDLLNKNGKSTTETILNAQSNLKDAVLESVTKAIKNATDQEKELSKAKRDKNAVQMKKLQIDLRNLYEAIHRSQQNLDMEQRTINQSIRDINTTLKVTNELKSSNQNGRRGPASPPEMATITMQAAQANVQNEMEIRLLREERKFSESAAKINVKRRMLADEKSNLDREKMEFERERERVREIEATSKSRLAEAEDLKRKAELLHHQQIRLIGDSELKLRDLSNERNLMKQRLQELEQLQLVREQKLYLEKSEILREKEFVERLRDQLLCPGCLNMMRKDKVMSFLMPPPPYNQPHPHHPPQHEEWGGGTAAKISHILTPQEKAYFLQE